MAAKAWPKLPAPHGLTCRHCIRAIERERDPFVRYQLWRGLAASHTARLREASEARLKQ